ncbi:MAG TPA: fatty acyl-AMP ligase [Archangium sp.]|nr:fatty acyl-AMP ligase [Archangium sp.]
MRSDLESPPYGHLIDVLRHHACQQPDTTAYTFLVDGEQQAETLTYRELETEARSIAAALQERGAQGRPVLLLFPPGLAYVRAFWGCLYAGAIAVPLYPPAPGQLERTLLRLRAILQDARPALVLTSADILEFAQAFIGQDSSLAGLSWMALEEVSSALAARWEDPDLTPKRLAFLQYTSGSTGTPKGVAITHANLIHNCQLICERCQHTRQSLAVIWLPPYHDMGLIGGILHPLYGGFPSVLMSPMHFLQNPLRWLRAITASRATISGGPNFAYELCARRATPEQLRGLDLSSWRVAFNGAEPVRHETLRRFSEVFAPVGFDPKAFFPCYGLAEATLIVSGGPASRGATTLQVDAAILKHERKLVTAGPQAEGLTCTSSGQPIPGQTVRIVSPETGRPCAPGEVGEIWLSGPSVAQGYWHQPETTRESFGARLADTQEGPFLRTGDLGSLVDGELYVLGRIKDLIIIDGANHAPQDIERTIEQSDSRIRPGCCAAFSIEDERQEKLVVLYEFRESLPEAERQQVHGSILSNMRRAVAREHSLRLYDAMALEPRTLPKTSSGKLQRFACRQTYLESRTKSPT